MPPEKTRLSAPTHVGCMTGIVDVGIPRMTSGHLRDSRLFWSQAAGRGNGISHRFGSDIALNKTATYRESDQIRLGLEAELAKHVGPVRFRGARLMARRSPT